MLRTDGRVLREDNYGAMREQLEAASALFGNRLRSGKPVDPHNVSDQRLRTWKVVFEEMGLLYVDGDGRVRTTRLGRTMLEGWERASLAVHDVNSRIAVLGAQVANRVCLYRPGASAKRNEGVPPDSDLRPLRVLWQAFRRLDDRLHWQDLNRVLGHVDYDAQVLPAIDAIRNHRDTYGDDAYGDDSLDLLGPAISDDPRKVTPWFAQAGLGGLLFAESANAAGYRTLQAGRVDLIDDLLASPPPPLPPEARASGEAYIRYLMDPVERAAMPIEDADRETVEQVVEACNHFGKSRFIVLSGLPGTGKTRLARLAADRLVDGDASRLKEVQFHGGTSYEDFVEGFMPRADGTGFQLRSKVLRVINTQALGDPENSYVLVIEEFTRADTHAVLGELLTYIEHRGRRFQFAVSQEEDSIAPNLIVIATMNPRDKSALQLDAAVRRRMHTIPVGPSHEALEGMLGDALEAEPLTRLVNWFRQNQASLPFGHGIFDGVTDEVTLRSAWNATVAPLLMDPVGGVAAPYRQAYDTFPFADADHQA